MDTKWRTGPIAITGSTGQVGRALQKRLTELPNEVRALDRGADLEQMLRDAEVVVHLAGTLQPRRPNTYEAANLATAQATAAALADSSAQRVVFLSFLTADLTAANPYLRFKAQAERALQETGVPTVVFRTGHIYGPPDSPGPTAQSLLARRGRASVLGPGTQRITPIFLDDVVEAVTRAALDPDTPTGTFPLTGPWTYTFDEFVRALNGPPVRMRHLPAWLARRLATVVPALPRPLVDVLLSDAAATGDPQTTADAFGVELHRVGDVWR